MRFKKNWLKVPPIKIACYFSVILNSFCVILGILYLSAPSYLILWDIFGIILLITIFGDLVLILINSNKKNGMCRFSTKMNIFSYCYLAFIILTMACMMLGNLLASVTYSNQLIDNLLAYILTYFFYFGSLFIGIIYAIFGIKVYNNITLGIENSNFNKTGSRNLMKTKI